MNCTVVVSKGYSIMTDFEMTYMNTQESWRNNSIATIFKFMYLLQYAQYTLKFL